jgi:ubiquinone/menaquinone biosynthesis C-methylase UbiE
MPSNSDSRAFKTRDASSYDSLTNEFDRFTERFTASLAERMVSLARLSTNERVLDIGTGTGIVAFRAAERVGPAGKVLGIDLSQEMLRTARSKALRAARSNGVEFSRMDAEALALEDCSFDAVLSLFALLHFPNPLAALQEMSRVLRPGGRLVVAIGSGPALLSCAALIQGMRHLNRIRLERQGKLLTAPRFLNALVEKYLPKPDEPEESSLAGRSLSRSRIIPPLVRAAGFAEVRTHWLGHQACVETPEEFWEIQRTFSSIARKRLGTAPPEQVEKLKMEFLEICRQVQSRGGKLVYPSAAFYVTAVRAAA